MDTLKYDIFAMKSEEMKFNAFFSYLRSFSEAGLETLQKLESDFHKEMKKNKNEKDTLAVMKNILTSYEVFILYFPSKVEIKDSCDFVEIPEFGFCIGKTFAQMIKIIKWFLRSWLSNYHPTPENSKKYEEIRGKLQSNEQKKAEELEQNINVCAFCEELLKVSPYSKDSKSKRKGVAINDMYDFRTAKKDHLQEKSHLMEFQEHVLEKYTLKEITSKRYIGDGEIDILNRKHATMKLQFSNGGNVLEEVLNDFNMKTEAIARFVNNSKIMDLQDYKMSTDVTYQNFEKEMRIKIQEKFQQARQKLKILLANKLQAYEKLKKSKMTHIETQTDFLEVNQRQKYEIKVKQMMVMIKKLNNQLQSEKQLNQSLKKLLQSKSIQFQQEFLKYRKEMIANHDPKSKTFLKSLKSLRQIIEGEDSEKQNSMKFVEAPSKERISTGIRVGGLMKDKTRKKKKKNSIRFTLQNQSNQDEQDRCPSIQSSNFCDQSFSQQQIMLNTVATQTEYLRKEGSKPSFGNEQKFVLLRKEQDSILPLTKDKKSLKKKVTLMEESLKRQQVSMYSHVKSRVYNRLEGSATLAKKQTKINEDTGFTHLIKKLAVDNFYSIVKSIESETVQVHKLTTEPSFSAVISINFTNEDVFNLYLNPKNAHNYQCLLFRNSIFNNTNLNPKRAVHFNHRINASDLDWNFKKEFETCASVEGKLASCIFYQFNALRKRERTIYDQLKLIMRSPTEIGNNIQIISLQGNQERESKDIDITELRKMVNIILKLHAGCIGNEHQSICSHIVKFCQKIGVKII